MAKLRLGGALSSSVNRIVVGAENRSAAVAVAVAAVAVVLIMGLANMLKGGSGNRSQQLMRWRVGLQFIAIIILMGVLYFRGH